MRVKLSEIFWTFFKVGCVLIGGGYVILPLVRAEMIEKRSWLSDEELVDFYAFSQAIPGLIACNLSMFIGYKLRRTAGALCAAFGMALSSFLPIIIIAMLIKQITHFSIIQSLFWGIGIGVCVLVFIAIQDIWQHAVVDKICIAIVALTYILMVIFNTSPAYIIAVAIVAGIVTEKFKVYDK